MKNKISVIQTDGFDFIDSEEYQTSDYNIYEKIEILDNYGITCKPYYIKSWYSKFDIDTMYFRFYYSIGYSCKYPLKNKDIKIPLRALGLYVFKDILKAYCIINHFKPEYSWGYFNEKEELKPKQPFNDLFLKGDIYLKLFENDNIYTFQDYVNIKFSKLSQEEYFKIVEKYMLYFETRESRMENARLHRESFERDEPTLRDVFDDYDQYSSWDNGR